MSVKKVDTASIHLWDQQVGAVSWLEDRELGVFEFDPAFLRQSLDIAPIEMPLSTALQGQRLFSFAGLNRDTFWGLPGLLADCLPDKFGNSVIDAWLARQGRSASSFSPVERLCYTGARGMGALEFKPAVMENHNRPAPVEVAELVDLAQQVMRERGRLNVDIDQTSDAGRQNAEAMADILRVGTSAGGARPKAVIAMNSDGKVISGQGDVPPGFDYWILKFDGVTDLELGEPQGFGRIEYAYSLMAKQAGIDMMPCRLLEENGRAHFMTRRFDRTGIDDITTGKLHMQSLCGMAHFDFNQPGAYGYEQAFMVMRQLRLARAEAEQLFRRMVFNVLARNQDDHTKNIAFLMGRDGHWHLSPAYDVIYSHNPAGQWTYQHQMSVNGKRDHFTRDDLLQVARFINLREPDTIIDEVDAAVRQWPQFASEADVAENRQQQIGENHRRI